MGLSVRARIALAMTVVVAANAAAAAFSWAYYSRAAEFGTAARQASVAARAASAAAQRITEFSADTSSLAFSLAGKARPQDTSALYGAVQGTDVAVSDALAALSKVTTGTMGSSLTTQWNEVRRVTYAWINAEAVSGGSVLRLRQLPDGRYQAGTASNITLPSDLQSMPAAGLAAASRQRVAALKDGSLRTLSRDADALSAQAAVDEEQARALARNGTAVLVLASLVLATAAAGWLHGTITRPLATAKLFADSVADGDLGATFDRHSDDEIGALTRSVEGMRDAVVRDLGVMREMAGAVLVTADGVRDAAAHALATIDAGGDFDESLAEDVVDVVTRAEVLMDLASEMAVG
jgi:HAMP domain-containing protein